MTDRELLELAAKAAGIEVTGDESKLGLQYVNGSEDSPFTDYWNPLTDDGDALRLAVNLRMLVDIYDRQSEAGISKIEFAIEPSNNDPYAATRRAIVRAAAEIGASL